ncbi:MobF family relaxase [Georgenia yuyongxinii]
MTVSMKVMHAGSGVEYFLKSVVAGDGDRNLRTPLTRYYTEAGTPPGRWLGSSIEQLGSDEAGRLHAGDEVTEEQLQLLIEQGRDPVTGEQLGKAFFAFTPGPDAVGKTRKAVNAYDLTFSVNKSVSVLWAVADAGVQEQIAIAHHEAVAEVMAYFEKRVAATRVGVASHNGAVGQVGTLGIVAAAYDHYDSRAGDPHLHTHVVVSSKVRTARDGRWRALDGRPVHAATVALSELYQGTLGDKLTERLGLGWEHRVRDRERNRAWELRIVPDGLVRLFSGRAREIDEEKDRLLAQYRSEHGRSPSTRTVLRLRQQATLATRPAKKRDQSLADLTARWRERLGRAVGKEASQWARERMLSDDCPPVYRADDLRPIAFEKFAALVLANVSEKRSTWRHWNLVAEASRQTMGVRFATNRDREQVIEAIVAVAEAQSVRLTPDDTGLTPEVFRRVDGTSIFRPKDMVQFSSADQLAAERRLLGLAEDTTGPRVPLAGIDDVAYHLAGDRRLRRDQADALGLIAASGRVVDSSSVPLALARRRRCSR